MMPRDDKRLKLVQRANGCSTATSRRVAARIIERYMPGCAAFVGLTTTQPRAGRNVGDGKDHRRMPGSGCFTQREREPAESKC